MEQPLLIISLYQSLGEINVNILESNVVLYKHLYIINIIFVI